MIQVEPITKKPRHDMIDARRIAADAAHSVHPRRVQSETAAQ
jgi:hypothetical protein